MERAGLMETWAVEDATDLLRRHGGSGGGVIANLMDQRPLESGHWMLWLAEDRADVLALPADGRPYEASANYHSLPFGACPCCTHVTEPVTLRVVVRGSGEVEVYGRTALEAAMAWGLVRVCGRSPPPLAAPRRACKVGWPAGPGRGTRDDPWPLRRLPRCRGPGHRGTARGHQTRPLADEDAGGQPQS